MFIDEIHTLVGAGGAEGAIDASNILKPALARGEIKCIGATTIDEYRKHIEKDAALERRFQTVNVEPPTREETINILFGLRDKYESHHKVKITDSALYMAVDLADRYITDRYMPDKAIETLMSHNFVPCEGGEHAIADQYMYAYLCKGINEMKAGNYEKALELLTFGQTLPQSLGAGIWNHCKYIPMRYRAALCLEALGRKSEADEIYRYIATTEIEYFSNMHLPELPYYQALSYDRLGESFQARSLITKYRRAWSTFEDIVDNGFFATTPFFMSFIEEPKKLRRAKALYFNGLVDRYLGLDAEADKKMAESFSLNNDNLFAKIM